MGLTLVLLIIQLMATADYRCESFCSRIFTAGTNYGKVGDSEEEVEQLPGVNSAYRRSVLESGRIPRRLHWGRGCASRP